MCVGEKTWEMCAHSEHLNNLPANTNESTRLGNVTGEVQGSLDLCTFVVGVWSQQVGGGQ